MIKSAARILLVDDHEMVRSTFQDVLNRIPGFEVVATAANRKEALKQLQHANCTIALIDINLDGESGTNLALEIRRVQPGIKTVFISASVFDRYVDHAIAMDADGFISKRESMERFIDGLQDIVQGKTFFSDDVKKRLAKCSVTGNVLKPLQTRRTIITPRQIEILKHIAHGRSKKQIAERLNVAVKTIDCHCDNMMKRLDLHDRVALTRYAVREGLISL